MKRILVLLLTVSMIAAAFAGCAEKFGSSSADTNGNGLRDDVELKIMKEKYKNDTKKKFNPDDFTVEYYGTYNDAVAIRIRRKGRSYMSVSTKETVGKFEFSYGSSNKIVVYANGKLISLFQAYDTGILTDSDVETIHLIYNGKQ